jgi:hypothetical protein
MKGLFADADLFANAQRPLPMASKEVVQVSRDFGVLQQWHETILFKSAFLTRRLSGADAFEPEVHASADGLSFVT